MPRNSPWKDDEDWSKSTEYRQYLLPEEAQITIDTPPAVVQSIFSWKRFFFFYLISSILLTGFGILIGRNLSSDANVSRSCSENWQKWSPIHEVDSSYRVVRFNGSFLKENVFRLPGSPEVDEAWESLGINYRALLVPKSIAAKSGLRPSQVQINPTYGGGYPANVEGLHHLHCLNLIRQALYYNIDYYRSAGKGAFANDEFIVRHHVSHCVDILRQQLMCTPNTALLGQVWWNRTQPKAFVDFNTEHKCRNYQAIREWAKKGQLPEKVPGDFLQPPNSIEEVFETIP